ncbi:hypothetical protein GCM10027430_05430 [Lysobacter tyrosinilyticus]
MRELGESLETHRWLRTVPALASKAATVASIGDDSLSAFLIGQEGATAIPNA